MKIFFLIFKITLTLILLVVLLIAVTVFLISLKKPSLERDWTEDAKILPSITISTSTVSVSNMRDWRYERGEVVSMDYYNDTFELNKMKGAYLVYNPFGAWEGVGHSFLIFEFEDGKAVSISIEARREKGEDYQAIKKGLFNEYEVWYVFGSPADLMTRRAILNDEELYQYPLFISTTTARAIFIDLATTAQSLESKPAFYHTIISNCTNLLADSANRVNKGSIPFHISRLFTGYADNQLYDLKLIPYDKPFEQIYREARVDESIRTDFASPDFSREEFNERILGEI